MFWLLPLLPGKACHRLVLLLLLLLLPGAAWRCLPLLPLADAPSADSHLLLLQVSFFHACPGHA